MAPERPASNKKLTNGLVGLSSAAVFAVYAAGYSRTQAAADRVDAATGPLKRAMPGQTSIAQAQVAPWVPAGAPADARGASPAGFGSSQPAMPPVQLKPANAASASAAPTQPSASTALAPAAAPVATSVPVAPTSVAGSSSAAAATPGAAAPADQPAVTYHSATESEAALLPPPAPKVFYKDGTYKAWGTCRHGDIEATVVVAEGKISTAFISQCWTRYSCSWIAPLPGEVVSRQSAEVDYISGATDSTYAFYYAVLGALNLAK